MGTGEERKCDMYAIEMTPLMGASSLIRDDQGNILTFDRIDDARERAMYLILTDMRGRYYEPVLYEAGGDENCS